MILLIAMALSIGVALVRGGRFRHLQGMSLRYGWLAFVAVAIQIGVIYFVPDRSGASLNPRVWLLVASHLLLIAVVALNLRIPGLWLIGVGLGLNLAAMLANGGYMPVTPETLIRAGLPKLASGELGSHILGAKDILLSKESTRLWILSDILTLPQALGLPYAFSIGDVVLSLGGFVLFQKTMRPSYPPQDSKADPTREKR